MRHFFESIPKRLLPDHLATRTAFNWIAIPVKARQLSARAETEITLTGTIQTAFARFIAIEIANIRSTSQKSNEAADETRGSGENQPQGERSVTESGHRFWDSDDLVRELWHRKEFWHSFGTVQGQMAGFESEELGSAL